MPRRNLRIAAALAAVLLAGTVQAQETAAPEPDQVIGTVNGDPITNRDIDFALGDLADQLGQVPPGQKRFAALMALIDIKLLAGKGVAEGVADTDAFKQRIAFLRERALHNEMFRTAIAEVITDEEIRARYDKEVAATPPENEVKAGHILVETEDEAKSVVERLKGGADFAELAKELSKDPGSGAAGGDLGYFTRGRMVPEFEQAAFGLQPGAFTETPVQTQFGWHVIRVDDVRPVQPPAFEQVAGQIRSILMRERYFEMLKGLREAGSVDVTEPDLKSAYDAAIAGQQ